MLKRLVPIASLISFSAFALTPPLGEKELRRQADLIVQAEVGSDIKNEGVVESNQCADTIKYVVPLKVVKVCKGKLRNGASLSVILFHKQYKAGCVGDQDATLHSKDQGLYYLRKGGDNGTWRPVHWDAVVLKKTDAPWPTCP